MSRAGPEVQWMRSAGESRPAGGSLSPPMAAAAVELALVVVMATAVGLSFSRVFGGASLAGLSGWPALGAVLLSVGATGARRWSPSASLLVSLAVGLVVVTIVTWGSPADLADAASAVLRAWEQILRAPLPVPDRPELLVVVPVSSWLVAHGAAELTLRRRSSLLPLVPVVVAVALPLVLGAKGEPPSNTVLGSLTLAAVAFVLVRTTGPTSSATRAAARLRRRRLVAALPVVVVAGVLPVVLGDHLPLSSGEARFDSRSEELGEPPEMLSPLAEVSAQRSSSEPRDLFVATAADGIEYWRLAVFDEFDGASWDSSATFVPAGRELPQSTPGADEAGGGDGAAADGTGSSSTSTMAESGAVVPQEITLQELDSAYLPLAGRALALDGPDVRFDPAGSTVLADDPVGEGTTYRVESVILEPSEAQLDVAQRDRSGADAEAARQPVEEAGVLADAAISIATQRSASQTGSADVRQLRALQDFFSDQSRFQLATEPVSGLSLRHLTAFVGAALEGGPAEGSVEQFAAAFTVMARTLGYPTRVVAGYRTTNREGGGYQVTDRDAFAWPEVKLQGLGWVEFPALPLREGATPPPTEVPSSTTSTTLADTGDATPTSEAAGGGSVPDSQSGSGGMPLWQQGLLALAAVVAAALVAAPLVRRQRRWRRSRDPDVSRRVDGAWRELLDRLAALQVPVTRSMTATEVVAVTSRHLDAAPPSEAHQLTWLVNLARFGPTEQPPAVATAAWRQADALLTWARRHLGRRTRLRAWIDPRATRT